MTAKELYTKFTHMDYSERRGDFWKGAAPKFEELLGKTIIDIYGAEQGGEIIAIVCDDDTGYLMYHEQDCCEDVRVEDICGDVKCLLNTPLTKAEEVVNDGGESDWGTSTWTFYHLATVKGYVTIRWLGESNGYYSESVDLIKINFLDGRDA